MKTENKVQAIKEIASFGKSPIHSNLNTCLTYSNKKDEFPLYKEVEGYEFKLVEIIPNVSKVCPKIHNSNIARYEKTGKRLPKDFSKLAIREMTLQGEI